MMSKDKSIDAQVSENLGRINGNRRTAPNPATIKDDEVMLPKPKSSDNGFSIRVNLD
jgi:hypothetical protein